MSDVDDVIVRLRGEAASALGAVNGVAAGLVALRASVAPAVAAITALSAAAIATATAMYGLARQAASYGEQLHNDAQKYGQQVEFLAALRYGASLANVEYGNLTIGLRTLARNMQEVNQGSAEQTAAFTRIGVSAMDVHGKIRPLDSVLLDLADKFKALPGGPEKTALAMQLFGRSGSQLIPLLNEGAAGIKKFREEAQRMGLVISNDQAEAADRFNDSIDRIKFRVQGLAITVGNALIPELQKLIDYLDSKFPAAADAFAEGMQRARQAAAGAERGAVRGLGAGAIGTVAGTVIGAVSGAAGQFPEEFIEARRQERLGMLAVRGEQARQAARDSEQAGQTMVRWLGVSTDALRMMTEAEKGAFIIQASLHDQVKDLAGSTDAYSLILRDEADALLLTSRVMGEHLQLQADETAAAKGLAAATSLIVSARAGLMGVTERAFDREMAALDNVGDRIRKLRLAAGGTTDPQELERLLGKTGELRSEAEQRGRTSVEAETKLLELERQRAAAVAQSSVGSLEQLNTRRAQIEAVDVQIQKQKEFLSTLQATGGQAADDVDRLVHEIEGKLKDAYHTTLTTAKDGFVALSDVIKNGKVPAEEYANVLRDGLGGAAEQARVLSVAISDVNAKLSSLKNDQLTAYALAKQTVASNASVFESDQSFGGTLTEAERSQAEADYQNRLSDDLRAAGAGSSGTGSWSSDVTGGGFSAFGSSVIPAFAGGGIVRRPTLALVGEAGPEAIIPLKRGGGGMGGINLSFTLSGGFSTADEIKRVVRDEVVPRLEEFQRRQKALV